MIKGAWIPDVLVMRREIVTNMGHDEIVFAELKSSGLNVATMVTWTYCLVAMKRPGETNSVFSSRQ